MRARITINPLDRLDLTNIKIDLFNAGNNIARNYVNILLIDANIGQFNLNLVEMLRNFFNNITWYEPFRSVDYQNLALKQLKLSESRSNLIPVLRNVAADDSWGYVRISRNITEVVPIIEKNSSPLVNGVPTRAQ